MAKIAVQTRVSRLEWDNFLGGTDAARERMLHSMAYEIAQTLVQVHGSYMVVREGADEVQGSYAVSLMAEGELEALVLDGCAQTQHRKPIVDAGGNTLGFTEWRAGSGLPWWPRRAQRNLDLHHSSLARKVVDDFGNTLTVGVNS